MCSLITHTRDLLAHTLRQDSFVLRLGLFATLLCAGAQAQEEPAEGGAPQSAAEKQRRYRALQQRAGQYELHSGTTTFPLTEQPILKYSNPIWPGGVVNGSTFLWVDETKPVAVCSLSIRRPNDSIHYEFMSFANLPLECHRDDGIIWSARSLPKPTIGTDWPEPSSTTGQRLLQLRKLASRFKANVYHRRTESETQLRLLRQPLYRYEHLTSGVVDGAIFAFVIANDPELLLQIEAVRTEATKLPTWQYRLIRMTSQQVEATLDGKPVWRVENFYVGARTADQPYAEGVVGLLDPPQ